MDNENILLVTKRFNKLIFHLFWEMYFNSRLPVKIITAGRKRKISQQSRTLLQVGTFHCDAIPGTLFIEDCAKQTCTS